MNAPPQSSVSSWLSLRFNMLPSTSLGWFRAGIGFYNKKEFQYAIECLERAVELDPRNVGIQRMLYSCCIHSMTPHNIYVFSSVCHASIMHFRLWHEHALLSIVR